MKAITNFEKVEEYPMCLKLYGTLGEFQRLVKHIDKTYLTPMDSFAEAVRDQVNTATKQIEKNFDLPE